MKNVVLFFVLAMLSVVVSADQVLTIDEWTAKVLYTCHMDSKFVEQTAFARDNKVTKESLQQAIVDFSGQKVRTEDMIFALIVIEIVYGENNEDVTPEVFRQTTFDNCLKRYQLTE